MAKKKEAPVKELKAITVDGLEVLDIKEINKEEISGKIGEVTFTWFKNGKRNTYGDNPKDLIFK